MNTKTIIAGILAGVAYFLLGGILYGMLLADTMASMAGSAKDVMRTPEQVAFPFLIIGNLFAGFLLAYIFGQWANISTPMGGLKAGAIIGFLAVSSFDCTLYATSNIMILQGILIDIVVFTVMSAIAGGVAGWWLGRK